MKLSPQSVESLGTIMGIWAHPDDESWAMAGLMIAARQNNQRVVCVTATAGEAGKTADENKWPSEKLAHIRKQELEDALRFLDVSEHFWLDYADGKLSEVDEVLAVKGLADIISKVEPTSIFTFEPGGITGHPDHKTISEWTSAAAADAAPDAAVYGATTLRETYLGAGRRLHAKLDIFFNVAEPVTVTKDEADLYFELPPEILDKKLECMERQPSQTASLFRDSGLASDVRQMFASEQFIKLT